MNRRALACGLPVIVLGKAVYDIAGLTFQGKLDEFWEAHTPPDMVLFDNFRRVLASRCLLPGSFFNGAGLGLAVDAAIDRLEAANARSARGDSAGTAAKPVGGRASVAAASSAR